MNTREGFVDAVGNTPLIKLRKASEITGCTILGKAEFLNPGGSVKDRTAKYIVLDAEKRGVLEPGGLIVEGTAGNTGIGLALVGNARGYRTLILMPDTQSQEKKDALRLCGAELREVPAVPFRDPNHYVHQAERTAEALSATESHGVLYANQWDNVANRDGHTDSTDYSFILENFLNASKDCCCLSGAAARETPITSITVKELRAMGWPELIVADINRDGVLDTEDMALYMEGYLPVMQPKAQKRAAGTR